MLCLGASDRLNVMRRAYKAGMTGPDYVWIYYTLVPGNTDSTLWDAGVDMTEEELVEAKKALLPYKEVNLTELY